MQTLFILIKLIAAQYNRPYPAVDKTFRFLYIAVKIFRVDLTHQHQVDDAAVFSFRVVARDEGALEHAQSRDHFVDDVVDDLVDAHVFMDKALQLRIERMFDVGAVFYDVALSVGDQVAGFGKVVEFVTDGVGGFPEFLGETAQVGFRMAVQEELEQHLHPGS